LIVFPFDAMRVDFLKGGVKKRGNWEKWQNKLDRTQ